jgi:glycosyltransferase involved in cell wall biosynthesis
VSRRLLLAAYFFPPLAGGGVHRVLSFVRHLPAHGWSCTVVCAGEEDYWVRDPSLRADVPAGTEVIRVAGGSALSAWLKVRGGMGRRRGGTFTGLRALANWWLVPDSYVGWVRPARAALERRVRAGGIDVLLSSSPPDSAHLAAEPVARRHRLPWVADFRDPWTGLSFFTPPTPYHRRRQQAMERRVLERADLVLTASRTHLDALGSPPGTRVRRAEHLPNGFEPAGRASEPEPPADTFRLVFTGTLNLMEDAGTLLEGVYELLAKHPEARRKLRVELAGPYDLDYEDRAEALGLKGIVRFPGALSHAEARALQRSADALLLWRPRGVGFRTMVPGKLYEYLDSGRPVVALLPEDDEAAALVREAGGAVVTPNDRAALAQELQKRYMAWKEHGRAPDTRPAWLEEHTRERLAARLAGWLDELAPAKR